MSDNDSEISEAPVSPGVSAGISPGFRSLTVSEKHAKSDADKDTEPTTPTKTSRSVSAAAASSVSSSAPDDDILQTQLRLQQKYILQNAVANPATYASPPSAPPPSVPPSDAAAAPADGVSAPATQAQAPGRKPPATAEAIDEKAATVVRTIERAFDDKAPRTVLQFPKHHVHLPASFVAIALPVVDVLRARKSNTGSRAGKDYSALLKLAVLLLNNNDTTRLEAAMLTLHSLHLAASSNLGSHIASWGEQFMLWSEENRVLMREAFDLFETMCHPDCRSLSLWYFESALSSQPKLPFSALLGRYTPAHVRKTPANLTSILATLKQHGKPMSCKEFQREARKISKPGVQRPRPSVARTSPLTKKVLSESKKVARCVAVVAETMEAADKDKFAAMVQMLPKEALLDEAVAFLEYPMQKRRKTS